MHLNPLLERIPLLYMSDFPINSSFYIFFTPDCFPSTRQFFRNKNNSSSQREQLTIFIRFTISLMLSQCEYRKSLNQVFHSVEQMLTYLVYSKVSQSYLLFYRFYCRPPRNLVMSLNMLFQDSYRTRMKLATSLHFSKKESSINLGLWSLYDF